MNTSLKFKLLLSTLLVVSLISSCIPSLHPIYTDATREVDDRLLGTWTMGSESFLSGIDYDLEITQNGDSTIRFSNSQSGEKLTKQMVREAFKIDHDKFFSTSNSTWTFERAAKVSFEKKSSGSMSTSISLSIGAPSFAPEGYEVTSSEELPFYILTHKEFEKNDTTTSYLLVHMTEIGGDMYLDFVPFPKGDKRRQGDFSANYISGHTFAKVGFDNGKLALSMFDGLFIEELIRSRKVRLRHEKLGVDGDIVLTASTKELRAFIGKYGDTDDMFDEAQMFVQL